RARERVVPADADFYEEALELPCPASDAGAPCHHTLIDAEIAAELMVDRLSEAGDFAAGMDRVEELRAAEREQHADDDDDDLVGELTPAVQRPRQTKAHGSPPSGYASVTEGRMSAMGG